MKEKGRKGKGKITIDDDDEKGRMGEERGRLWIADIRNNGMKEN